jgi:hypothetical protein
MLTSVQCARVQRFVAAEPGRGDVHVVLALNLVLERRT